MSVVFPINPDDRFEEYTATAGQTVFSVPFPFQDNRDIIVIKIAAADGAISTLTLTTHYTLSGAGTAGPGSMTLVTGAAVGDKFRIIGSAVLDRLTSIVRDGRYSSRAQDDEHDRHRIIQQELQREAGRALKSDYGQAGLTIDASAVTEGKALVRGPGNTVIAGPTSNEIAAAQGYAESASQSKTDAETAKDDAETAAAAAQAATQFTHVVLTDVIDGVGPYDMGVAIGAEANLFLTIGNLPQAVGTYTISGTTFTLNSVDGIDGLPFEARVIGNVRALNAPADGSVGEAQLAGPVAAKLNNLVFASDYASNQLAAEAAIALGKPLFVPQTGGITIQVPEDIADLQDAINTVASWIFPSGVAADQNAPYADPTLVTISLEDAVLNTVGKGFVWPLPKGGAGDKVTLAGRGKTAFNITSLHSQTGLSGLVFLTCNVSAIPAGLTAGSYICILLTTGSGEHYVVRGCWQVTAVDAVNTRITFKVKDRTELSIPSLALTSASCFFIPTGLQFQGMPYDGNDRGGIDVPENCQLRIKDIVLIGDPNGGAANASSTNGIIARKGAAIDFGQHMGIHGFPRKGVWFVEAGEGKLSYGMISVCDQAVKGDTGAKIVFDYGVANGNVSNNVATGIGATVSAAPLTACGCPGQSLLAVDNSEIITSLAAGLSRISNSGYGAVAQTGAEIHLNDMAVVGCTVGASARPQSSIYTTGVFTSNGTDYKPAINTPSSGALVSNSFSSDL